MTQIKRAFEFREKVRDDHVARIVGAGLATRAEYDEPAIMQAYADAETAELRSQRQREMDEAREAFGEQVKHTDFVRAEYQKRLASAEQQLQQMKERNAELEAMVSGLRDAAEGRTRPFAEIKAALRSKEE